MEYATETGTRMSQECILTLNKAKLNNRTLKDESYSLSYPCCDFRMRRLTVCSRCSLCSDEEKQKTILDYVEHYSRPSVSWYKGIMVEQAKEWEYLSYDVREVRKVAEGFEVLSNGVQEQQRNAYKNIHFHRKCSELGHTPGVKVEESKKTDAYREQLQNECMDPEGKLNLLKCTDSQWAQYIGSNEDFYENMPGFQADPFKYVPGNALVMEPCNTL